MAQIYNIGSKARNNWLIEANDGVIAIDTGTPSSFNRFIGRFCNQWKLGDLRYVFLTHAHNDHAGFVKAVLDQTEAKVVLSKAASRVLALGQATEPHEYKNWFGGVLELAMASPFGKFPKAAPSGRMVFAEGGEALFSDLGLKASVVPLKGHTSDSIGLYLENEGALFCGDAAMNRPPLNSNLHTVIIENVDEFQQSWDRMISLNPKLVYPGHGEPFPISLLIKHRRFLG